MRLAGAVALVTGASSGIGRAAAVLLAGRGASTALAGRDDRARAAVYAATKAGLATFADSVREEVAGRGVTVSVVVPGVVDTAFFDRRGSAYDRAWPVPVPAERVARALLRAVESDRAEVFAPAWTRLPARLKGAAPGLYRTLALRFGQARSH